MSTERRSSIPAAAKREVLDRAYNPRKKMFKCAQCGDLYPKKDVQIDHIKEWADTKEWPDEERHAVHNLQILCREDHRRKTNRSAVKRRRAAKTRVHLIGRIVFGSLLLVALAAFVYYAAAWSGDTETAAYLAALYAHVTVVVVALGVLVGVGAVLVSRARSGAVKADPERHEREEARLRSWLLKSVPDSRINVTWPDPDAGPTVRVKYPSYTPTTAGTFWNDLQDKVDEMYPNTNMRVYPDTGSDTFTIRDGVDPLAAPVTALPMSEIEARGDYSSVDLGMLENGERFTLRLMETHTLVAGATRSGKSAGFFWSVIRGLAPGIRAGVVKVHAIDPKGGVELSPGLELWDSYSDGDETKNVPSIRQWWDEIEEAKERVEDSGGSKARKPSVPDEPTSQDMHVAVLDDAVLQLKDQLRRMKAQRLRKIEKPTREFPLHLVVIDEAATVLSYASDAKLKKAAQNALEYLTSQGAAAGFHVMCLAQDPSAETVKIRALLPTRTALRLDSSTQVRMVLGDGAVAAGARAHKISRTMQGTGYINSEMDTRPVRYRTPYVDNAEIEMLAREYAPAVYQPVTFSKD